MPKYSVNLMGVIEVESDEEAMKIASKFADILNQQKETADVWSVADDGIVNEDGDTVTEDY